MEAGSVLLERRTENGEITLPNTKSALKRLRQSQRRRAANKAKLSRLKTAIKRVRLATEPDPASKAFRHAARLLDRAVSQGLVHRNTAARNKSRLAAHVRRLGGSP